MLGKVQLFLCTGGGSEMRHRVYYKIKYVGSLRISGFHTLHMIECGEFTDPKVSALQSLIL